MCAKVNGVYTIFNIILKFEEFSLALNHNNTVEFMKKQAEIPIFLLNVVI